MPMNNRLLRPLQTPGLLDLVPGAAAAYSLRSLSNSYADPVVTVRRSSDDAEEDFTAAEVADGTLAAFCGAGDGFVKTWHSQTGSNDASQTTAGYQPKLVSSGVVITEEGKPAIQFDGSDDYLDCGIALMPASGPVSIFAVAAGDAGSSGLGIVSQYRTGVGFTSRCIFGYNAVAGNGYYWFNGSATEPLLISSQYIANDENTLISLVMPTPNSGYIYANAANYADDTAINTSRLQINTEISNAVAPFLGTISEALIYAADLTAQRELIEGNIAWSYSV